MTAVKKKKSHASLEALSKLSLPAKRASFTYKIRESIASARYLKSQGVENAVRLISNKRAHRQIARQTGVRPPKLYAGPATKGDLKEPRQSKFVIKPIHGANGKGVQLIRRTETGFRNIRTKETLPDWPSILAAYPSKSQLLQVEELIRSDDYKLYSFYGEVALILQKRMVANKPRYRWYDAEWRPIRTGKYRISPGLKRPSQEGQTALMEAARQISLAIPLPFVRVDLYLTRNNGVRLGEVTPHPGSYFKFNEQWDERLGRSYEEAAARLHTDLLHGSGPRNFLERRSIRSIIREFLSR